MDLKHFDHLIADLHTSDVCVQKDAVRGLSRLRASDAVDDLVSLLHPGTDGNLRRLVIKALGKIGDPRAIAPLAELIDDPQAKPGAMTSLLRLGVFDGLLPEGRRERRHFTIALQFAKSEIKNLILDDRLSRESLRSVLPPIM